MSHRSNSFLKRTKKGNVLKVVKEHYLRDDICCGSPLCDSCPPPVESSSSTPTPSLRADAPHYLVLDTNVVLHSIDALENSAFKSMIFLEIVLDETKHRNIKTYERARALIADVSRGCFVFSNEHHSGTFIERQPSETPNDRNDRAIRKAAWWYGTHLPPQAPPVILLTNDQGNKQKAESENIRCMTIQEYVGTYLAASQPDLVAKVARAGDALDPESRPGHFYTEHLSPSELEKGISSGRLFRSKIRINRNFWSEGWVNVPGQEKEVVIRGAENINRAMEGDEVVVELLDQTKWTSASNGVEQSQSGLLNPEEENGATKPAQQSNKVGADKACGKVVGILSRNWRQYCGSIEETDVKEGRVLFIALDQRIPKIRIHSRQVDTIIDKRIVVAIDSWPTDSRWPLGHYVKTLGVIGDRDTETQALMMEHDVTDPNWSDQILASLPPPDYCIPDDEIARRVDLRQTCIFSIDPPGCKDIDDALHLVELPNGNFEIGVHIADVSHFIAADSPLDLEAADRATSVYLVERRIDMLPELLSTNMCSLIANVDRLTFSVLWEVTPDAKIVNTRFHKTVIHSAAAMAYSQAQDLIDANALDHKYGRPIILMNRIAKQLRANRIAKGSLTLASPAVKFVMDSQAQAPSDVEMYQLKEAHALVEEYMLLANVSVAEFILQNFPQFSMLRRHPTPVPSFFDSLHRALGALGMRIDTTSSRALALSLDQCVLPDYPYFNTMVRILTTRCMTQAIYFCSGDVPPQDFMHYGLAAAVYTHFTSPIRRYADIVVHRLLAAALEISPLPHSLEDRERVRKVADGINHRHRMAQLCGRASVNLHTLIFFKDRRVQTDAVIMGVKANGIVVMVPKYGMESPIQFASKEDAAKAGSGFHFDEEKMTLTCPEGNFQIFDRLRVEIYVEQLKHHRQKLVIKVVKRQSALDTSSSISAATVTSPVSALESIGIIDPSKEDCVFADLDESDEKTAAPAISFKNSSTEQALAQAASADVSVQEANNDADDAADDKAQAAKRRKLQKSSAKK